MLPSYVFRIVFQNDIFLNFFSLLDRESENVWRGEVENIMEIEGWSHREVWLVVLLNVPSEMIGLFCRICNEKVGRSVTLFIFTINFNDT